jgi:hypothetical protein
MQTTQAPTAVTFPQTTAARSLMHDFLGWLAEEPRAYEDVMDAWRTSCPRLSIWEDALAENFVRTARGDGELARQVIVTLTDAGRAFLRR